MDPSEVSNSYTLTFGPSLHQHKRAWEQPTEVFHKKKKFLKISLNLQENTCVGVCNFIKKRLQHRSFPVNLEQFFPGHCFFEHTYTPFHIIHCLSITVFCYLSKKVGTLKNGSRQGRIQVYLNSV